MTDGYVKKSSAVDPLKKYSYADYLTWPDDERWEIIEGEAWDMSPAPTTSHQIIVVELAAILRDHLKGKNAESLYLTSMSDSSMKNPILLCSPIYR